MFFFIARRDNVVEKTIDCFAYKWDAHSTEGQKVFLAGIKSRLQVSAKEYIVDFVSLSRVPEWKNVRFPRLTVLVNAIGWINYQRSTSDAPVEGESSSRS
jgi:hypothetical protein